MMNRRDILAGSVALGLVACGKKACAGRRQLRTVSFGMLPYADHTQASIGIAKGWFDRAGIELQANVIRIEQVVSFLSNKTYDVISTPPGVLIAGYNEAPDLVMATFSDLFQGYALIAAPNGNYKSYSELVQAGRSAPEALREAVQQIRGARFTYPPEGGIQPFIDLMLETGGLTRRDFRPLVVDDPIGVAAMKRGDADFQTGGVPSRLALQKTGFKVIATAGDFAKLAKPSIHSKALQAVLPGGWAMRRDFYEANPDVVIRLAAVSFQINDLIATAPQEAASIHMRYLSRVTGQPFDYRDAQIIYGDLDPFLTFEQQERWFEDKSNPLYYEYLIGAQIESFKEDKAFSGKAPNVADLIVANDVYRKLKVQKDLCDANPNARNRALSETGGRAYYACATHG